MVWSRSTQAFFRVACKARPTRTAQPVPHRIVPFYTVGIIVIPAPYRSIPSRTVGWPKVPHWPMPCTCTFHLARYRLFIRTKSSCTVLFDGPDTGSRLRADYGPGSCKVVRYRHPMPRGYTHAQLHPPVHRQAAYFSVVGLVQRGCYFCEGRERVCERILWRRMPSRARAARRERRNRRLSHSHSRTRCGEVGRRQ